MKFVRKIYLQEYCDFILNYEVGESSPSDVLNRALSNIDNVKEGDLIFCRSDYVMNGGLRYYLDQTKVQINLMIHGGDYLVHHEWLDSPKIKNLFAANLNGNTRDFKHTMCYAIPWGWGEVRHGDLTDQQLKQIREERILFGQKENKVYVPFHTTNGYGSSTVRNSFLEEIQRSTINHRLPVEHSSSWIDSNLHTEKVMNSKFCVVIPGASWGNQPGRIWECLLRDTIPITKRCYSDWWKSEVEQFSIIHKLPIIFVDDWDDLTEDIFDIEVDSDLILDRITQPYWESFINLVRNKK